MNGVFTPRSGISFVGTLTRRRRKDSSSLQGSAAPSAGIARHSGAERLARARMSTMTFAETGHSLRALGLSDIIAGHKFSAGKATLKFREILERLAYSGWPGLLNGMTPTLLEGFRDYLNSLVEVELATGIGTGREPMRVYRLPVALARRASTGISISTLASDEGLTSETVSSYLATLTWVFAIEDPPAQSSHLRSKVMLRTEGKHPLVDPSLAVAALRADPQNLLCDLRYAEQLFGSQTVHDPCMYSGQLVRHVRVSAGAEVDTVIEYPGDPLLLIEIRLGLHEGVIKVALTSLARFAARINPTLHPDVVRLIITGGTQAFTYPGRS